MWRTVPQRLSQVSKQCSVCLASSTSPFSFRKAKPSAIFNKTGLLKSKPAFDGHCSLWTSSSLESTTPIHTKMATLETLNLENGVLNALPVDDIKSNVVRKVAGACYCLVECTPVSNPTVVVSSTSALELLDLPESEVQRPDFAEYFSGNKVLPGSQTAAHCYCGHQFGYFAGQLGDGAAVYLGEVVNKAGERWEFQIKGAGKTPFSRTADGRKVLRSSIREFLCSEAIHHLGIASTRAGACLTSDTTVIRDIFYDGHAKAEKASIVLRMAPTFIRFGSFEIFKETDAETGREGPSAGRVDILQQLTEYVIKTYYPQINGEHQEDKKRMYVEFYRQVVQRTAELVAKWQSVGWCHGVLNTDNMSIVGLTIDYGPYGFLDRYDSGFICNASDDGGRYAFDKQPEICKWNCMKLAEALQPLISLEETQPILDTFEQEYTTHYMNLMRKKLGLLKQSLAEDTDLIDSLLTTMETTGADFTNTFRGLSKLPLPGCEDHEVKTVEVQDYLLTQCCTLMEMKQAYKPQMDPRQLQMFVMLLEMNPHLLSQMGKGHRAITRELDRIDKTKQLQDMTQTKKRQGDAALWQQWLQKYTHRLQLEIQGSADLQTANQERVQVMNQTNPRFILRNYIAQNAIEAAENGDFSEVQRVLKLLENPYSDEDMIPHSDDSSATTSEACHVTYDGKPPTWATTLRVT